jgi:hypothetical protein
MADYHSVEELVSWALMEQQKLSHRRAWWLAVGLYASGEGSLLVPTEQQRIESGFHLQVWNGFLALSSKLRVAVGQQRWQASVIWCPQCNGSLGVLCWGMGFQEPQQLLQSGGNPSLLPAGVLGPVCQVLASRRHRNCCHQGRTKPLGTGSPGVCLLVQASRTAVQQLLLA